MDTNLTNLNNDKVENSTLASYAPLNSPALTGAPTAPTQTAGNSSTRLATTEFVDTGYASKANANTFASKQTFNDAIVEGYLAMPANAIDCATAAVFSKTISGATTLTVTNVAAAGNVTSFILELTNGGTNVTWWTGVKWAGGTVPSLTTTGTDILGFYTRDGGTIWRGMMMSKDSK